MRAWLVGVLLLAGCGRYADFTLPPPVGPAGEGKWTWAPSPEPVLKNGGKYDSVDALNPEVWQATDGWSMTYSGWDGRVWRTLSAVSKDGVAWTKSDRVMIEPNPSTWEGNYIAANGFGPWYQAGTPPQIGDSRSRQVAVPRGPRGAWDEMGVGDPYIVGRYIFFLGQDRARRQRLGVAELRGGTWYKLASNPILELGEPGAFDEKGLGEPAVWEQHGRWWMLYTGRDKKEWRRIGLAVSRDGIQWSRIPGPPIIDVGAEGTWNSRVVCDPHVVQQPDGSVRVYFGGGNKPQPAENLNGQIGVGVLRYGE